MWESCTKLCRTFSVNRETVSSPETQGRTSKDVELKSFVEIWNALHDRCNCLTYIVSVAKPLHLRIALPELGNLTSTLWLIWSVVCYAATPNAVLRIRDLKRIGMVDGKPCSRSSWLTWHIHFSASPKIWFFSWVFRERTYLAVRGLRSL